MGLNLEEAMYVVSFVPNLLGLLGLIGVGSYESSDKNSFEEVGNKKNVEEVVYSSRWGYI